MFLCVCASCANDWNTDMEISLSQSAKLLADYAVRMVRCGSETRIAVQNTERLSKAFGFASADVAVVSGLVSVCLSDEHQTVSAMRRSDVIGINMSTLHALTNLVIDAESGNLSLEEFEDRMRLIGNYEYPKWLMVLVIGLAAYGFAFINEGGFECCLVSFAAGSLSFITRYALFKLKVFAMGVFLSCGFVGTLAAGELSFALGLAPQDSIIAMIVSVLLFVPGFPFMTGFSDLIKGYYSMAITRLALTFIHLSFVTVGILLAFSVLSVHGWV